MAPAITGTSKSTVAHNESLTLTGTDFGARTRATPLRYLDFEGMTVGEDVVDEAPDWTGASGTAGAAVVSTENLRNARSTRHAKVGGQIINGVAQYSAQLCTDNIGIALTGMAFLYYWRRKSWGGAVLAADDDFQIKTHRLGASIDVGGREVNDPSMAHTSWSRGGWPRGDYVNGYNNMQVTISAAAGGTLDTLYSGEVRSPSHYAPIEMGDARWINYIEWVDMGSIGGLDAYVKLLCNDLASASYKYTTLIEEGNLPMIEAGQSYYDALRLNLFPGSVSAGEDLDITQYWDNVVVDDSHAQVFIGDAATWADCTVLEYQYCTSRSDTSINLTVKRGSLNAGTAYLYVVDESLNISPGYAITIGEAAGGGGEAGADSSTSIRVAVGI